MDQTRLDRSDAAYPTALNHYLGKDAPLSVAALGNSEIIQPNPNLESFPLRDFSRLIYTSRVRVPV